MILHGDKHDSDAVAGIEGWSVRCDIGRDLVEVEMEMETTTVGLYECDSDGDCGVEECDGDGDSVTDQCRCVSY